MYVLVEKFVLWRSLEIFKKITSLSDVLMMEVKTSHKKIDAPVICI